MISSQGSEIDPRFIGAQERVVSVCLRNIGRADNVCGVVAVGGAARATERSEVLHLAILINKGVKRTITGQSGTDHVPGCIDAVRRARRAAECSEIGDGIVVLCLNAREARKEGGNNREREFNFHGEWRLVMRGPSPRKGQS